MVSGVSLARFEGKVSFRLPLLCVRELCCLIQRIKDWVAGVFSKLQSTWKGCWGSRTQQPPSALRVDDGIDKTKREGNLDPLLQFYAKKGIAQDSPLPDQTPGSLGLPNYMFPDGATVGQAIQLMIQEINGLIQENQSLFGVIDETRSIELSVSSDSPLSKFVIWRIPSLNESCLSAIFRALKEKGHLYSVEEVETMNYKIQA